MRDFHLPGRSPVFAMNGICATSHPLAAKVAVQMLEQGGNAVDAAIAAAVLLGICEPQMTGLAGDCFVLLKPAGEQRILALNGSGRAPQNIDAAALRAKGLAAVPPDGPEAVTLPGAIDAFCTLSAEWGRKGLDASLAPAIRYADEGVPVGPRTAFDWAGDVDWIKGDARGFYLTDGKAPRAGDVFKNDAVSEHGAGDESPLAHDAARCTASAMDKTASASKPALRRPSATPVSIGFGEPRVGKRAGPAT